MLGSFSLSMFDVTSNNWFMLDKRYGYFAYDIISPNYDTGKFTIIEDIELSQINRESGPEYFAEGSPFAARDGNLPLVSAADPTKVILKNTAEISGS